MDNLNEKEEVREEIQEMSLKPLKSGQIPKSGDYEGKEEDFGKSGRKFKFYVNGVDAAGNDKLIDIPIITPKNRHMIKYIVLTIRFRRINEFGADVNLFDEVLDYIENYYSVPSSYIDRIDTSELMGLIDFIGVISVTPRKN
jgi:hypothetical protein